MHHSNNFYLGQKNFIYILLLSLLHIFFHYFFFERAALAPDDYANIINLKNNIFLKSNLLDYFLRFNDRPISNFVIVSIHNLFNENTFYYFIALVSSSLLVLISIFILINIIIQDLKLAFILTILYDLLPNKFETFHSSIFININLVTLFYVITIIFFFLFYFNKNIVFLFFSYLFYLFSVFWYEVGFFIPIIFFIYINLYKHPEYSKKYLYLLLSIFLIIMTFYFLFRINFFHLSNEIESAKSINFSLIPNAILEIIKSYFGRYIIRSIVYGFYLFVNLNLFYIIFLLILNLFISILFYKFLNVLKSIKFDLKFLIFLISFFIITLIPNILYGGFGGRHSLLPSITFIIIIYYLITLYKFRYTFHIISFLVFIGICVSQGNTWSQAISLRIINSFYETSKENSMHLVKSENIIVDVNSFKKNIQYSLLNNQHNNFNTYFGSQLFEDWGIRSIITIATQYSVHNNIFISASNLKKDDNFTKFYVLNQIGYNKVNKKLLKVPNNKLFIIDYNLVYKNGYFDGKRYLK